MDKEEIALLRKFMKMECHMCGKDFEPEDMLSDNIYTYYVCKNCCRINRELINTEDE